jgi:6-phosphofructokinase 1
MIILAEGAGNKEEICSKIKELTGISVKTTTLGHIQRGGSPTMADRILAVKLAVKAVDLVLENKTNRVVGIKNNEIIDLDISEALAIPRKFDTKLHDIAHILSL